MTTLVPTVHERLARCGTRVYVDGLVAGADVELDVGGAVIPFTASGGASHVAVAPLSAGAKVRSRQNAGSGWTPWSPEVTVEDAEVPPVSAPHLPAQVGQCGQCVWVTSLVPGCKVELLIGSSVVGTGTADRNGRCCAPIDLRLEGDLKARMLVCDSPGPLASTPIVEQAPLPAPVVGRPLYGCQRIVPLSDLRMGARVRLESDVSGGLGSLCSCWEAVNVRVGADLVVGHNIRAQSYWDREDCKGEGPWGAWERVVEPDEGIKPVVEEALVEGDRTIRVSNQILGADLTIYIAASADPADVASPDSYGPRPASEEPEIDLNEPLAEGNLVWVDQTLCGHTETSDAVLVRGRPEKIFAPAVMPPLYACAYQVVVTGLHVGATVRVYKDGFPIGIGWSGLASSITVETLELVAGSQITARQWVGGVPSPESAPVVVQEPGELYSPRVVQPVTLHDRAVWVSGVTPGARVTIHSAGSLLGEGQSAEPLIKVATLPITGAVEPRVSLCDHWNSGGSVEPLQDPCGEGAWSRVGSRFRDYGSFLVDDWDDGGNFEHPIKGQLYYPAAPPGCLFPFARRPLIHPKARNLPLVIIAHGYWLLPASSYLGYGYLASHLARWGMVVFSLDLDVVNHQHFAPTDPPHQSARGEIILKAIESVLADPEIGGHLNQQAIGLIGHSMGGEGVVVAQQINLSRSDPFGIRGVVSIAPTQYRQDVRLVGCDYLQLFGSEDYLLGFTHEILGDDADVRYNGFRIYDRAERNKSHAWIHGASHDPFNSEWIRDPDKFPVTDAEHQRTAMCLINAFFQKCLENHAGYEGYLEGMILPPSIRSLKIYMQHLKAARQLLDNFGDADPQIGLPGEALDKTHNRMAGVASAAGPGLVEWEDVQTIGAGQCVHNTSAVELGWQMPEASYASAGGLDLSLAVRNLSWRICQFYEDAAKNPPGGALDLLVEIEDGSQASLVRMGMVGAAPYPDEALQPYSVFRSVRIPADAFGAVNPGLNLGAVSGIRLRLSGSPTGHMLVDDLEADM